MAGKNITLPLGLNISDVSPIGNYSALTGRNYVFRDIKLSEARNVVGGNYSVGSVCSSLNINYWAAFKPWRRGTTGTDSGMVKGSHDITYVKPTDTSGYHLGDFAGYNHQAPVPGIISGQQTLYYQSLGWQDFTLTVSLPEFDVRDFDFMIQGIIVNVAGWEYFTPLTDNDIINKTKSFTFSINCTSAQSVSATLLIQLGGEIGDEPVYVCNFPNPTLSALSEGITVYNGTIPAINLTTGDGNISASWDARSNEIVDSYRFAKLIDGTYVNIYVGTLTSFVDVLVNSGTRYYYRLTIRYKDGSISPNYTYANIIALEGDSGGT